MTLIELVITIGVGAVVVAFMALFIVGPMDAYSAQSRRADLVDEADGALRFMARDIRSALPNSVRVSSTGSVVALELLATIDGARYQESGALGVPALELDLTQADGAFATTVPFTQLALPWSSTSAYLAIYNVGVPGANAYELANVITPAGTTISVTAGAAANQQRVTLAPSFKFAWDSPGRRVYLVAGPVTYLCDTAAGTLTRYAGYAVSTSQPVSAGALAAAGAAAGRIAADISACQFAYAAGTPQRNALATLTLQLARGGETVQLLHQVQLVNTP
jgi:MSHA biogenesis protein MshO